MNQALLRELIEKALARKIAFPEIVATVRKEGVESYHVATSDAMTASTCSIFQARVRHLHNNSMEKI